MVIKRRKRKNKILLKQKRKLNAIWLNLVEHLINFIILTYTHSVYNDIKTE